MSEPPLNDPPDRADGAQEPGSGDRARPPTTGNRLVDAVLAELGDLDERPVEERLERLTAAQQGLAEILDGTRGRRPAPGGPA